MPIITGDNITYMPELITDTKNDRYCISDLYDTMVVENPRRNNHYFRIAINDFFIKHREELRRYKQTYHVGDTWFYRPKGVSQQIYGTTELWLALLRLNNMTSAAEFCRPIIFVYEPNGLKQLVDIFYQREGKGKFGK